VENSLFSRGVISIRLRHSRTIGIRPRRLILSPIVT
jgi:hypothetical protein